MLNPIISPARTPASIARRLADRGHHKAAEAYRAAPNPNGLIIHRGPSLLTGEPIMVVLTGLTTNSANAKTGRMLQTWILRSDRLPTEAIADGSDDAICGDCPLRGDRDPVTGKMRRPCYVNVGQAPQAIARAAFSGAYADFTDPALMEQDFGGDAATACVVEGHQTALRIGSYGDPAATSSALWAMLAYAAPRNTGYSHQWRDTSPTDLGRSVMASVETPADAEQARRNGWRTFRVTRDLDTIDPAAEVLCPASDEAGKRTRCADCSLCSGNGTTAKSVVIKAHGTGSKHATMVV